MRPWAESRSAFAPCRSASSSTERALAASRSARSAPSERSRSALRELAAARSARTFFVSLSSEANPARLDCAEPRSASSPPMRALAPSRSLLSEPMRACAACSSPSSCALASYWVFSSALVPSSSVVSVESRPEMAVRSLTASSWAARTETSSASEDRAAVRCVFHSADVTRRRRQRHRSQPTSSPTRSASKRAGRSSSSAQIMMVWSPCVRRSLVCGCAVRL